MGGEAYWDELYGRGRTSDPDPWFLPLLPPPPARVLDVGCGDGVSLGLLAGAGYLPTGLDASAVAVARCRLAYPQLPVVQADLSRAAGLFAGEPFDAVLADLVLHYLPWADTVSAVRGLAGLLTTPGRLLFRVNAAGDEGSGYGQGRELEPGLYDHPAQGPKRFFSAEDVRSLFREAGFVRCETWRCETGKYGTVKAAWAGVAYPR